METTGNFIMFYLLAAIIIVCSILAVTSRKMLRTATYLLFVLISTAGLYALLNYHFLAVVQLSVYAGGILILFIFVILLTSAKGDKTEPHDRINLVTGSIAALAGIVLTTIITLKHKVLYMDNPTITGEQEINMKEIGYALMGTEKYQYMLPFEVLGFLLLACVIGSILIARKR